MYILQYDVKGRIREERKKSNLSCRQLLRYTEGE